MKELKQLQLLSKNDPFITAALNTVPSGVAAAGIPTLPQMHTRFQRVMVEARVAARVPEDSGFGGMVLGRITAALLLSSSDGDGGDVDNTLTLADRALVRGELATAVRLLQQLKGAPADTCKDVLAIMQQRLAVEMALKSIKAHATLLASK